MDEQAVRQWLLGRLPDGFYLEPPVIVVEDEEIAILGTLPEPQDTIENPQLRLAEQAAIASHRESTRNLRSALAQQLSAVARKPVAWGARCGPTEVYFSSRRLPFMIRLDRTERRVLDILVRSGVCRSRNEAVGWCLRSIADDRAEWLAEVESAFDRLEAVRSRAVQDS